MPEAALAADKTFFCLKTLHLLCQPLGSRLGGMGPAPLGPGAYLHLGPESHGPFIWPWALGQWAQWALGPLYGGVRAKNHFENLVHLRYLRHRGSVSCHSMYGSWEAAMCPRGP